MTVVTIQTVKNGLQPNGAITVTENVKKIIDNETSYTLVINENWKRIIDKKTKEILKIY